MLLFSELYKDSVHFNRIWNLGTRFSLLLVFIYWLFYLFVQKKQFYLQLIYFLCIFNSLLCTFVSASLHFIWSRLYFILSFVDYTLIHCVCVCKWLICKHFNSVLLIYHSVECHFLWTVLHVSSSFWPFWPFIVPDKQKTTSMSN